MKRKTIYAALLLLALSAPAVAQGIEPGTLPPHEILSLLRSTGFDPVGRPVRRGPNYVLDAIDENDRDVRLVVSARSGDILSVTPVQTASRTPSGGGIIMGPYERMPPGYVSPGGHRSSGAPVAGNDGAPPPSGYGVRPPAPIPGALPRSSSAAPLPNRGSMMPGTEDDDGSPSSVPNAVRADRDRNAGLPPPPERFPQRVAPQAQPKPKPVKRAAAAPPKQTPLPRPKPGADTKSGGNAEALPQPQSPPPASWPEEKPAGAESLPN